MIIQTGQTQKGFTLVELALVLIIFGLVLSAVMAGFTLYNKQATAGKTDEAMQNSDAALLEYVARFGVYPCPADPTLGPGDANYGREQRDGGLAPGDPGYDDADCIFPATAKLGKDSDGDGTGDNILIGSIPSVTITERLLATNVMDSDFTDHDSTDGWGRKLTYAVTERLTDLSDYNSYEGAIGIVDENNRSVLKEAETDGDSDGVADPAEDLNGNGILDAGRYPHFVLISHGEDGRGAYMRDGTLVENCTTTVPIPNPAPPGTAAVNQIKNCDQANGIFLSGLINESPMSYNDDIVKFSSYVESALWRYTGLGKIENTNQGFVGIGTNTPQEKLHVVGEITANRTRAIGYTDRVGNNYVPPATLGGDGVTLPESVAMQCPVGEVVSSIEGQQIGTDADGNPIIRPKVNCHNPYTNIPDATCPVVGGVQYVMDGIELNPATNAAVPHCCNPTLPKTDPDPACH
jgi:prepilin-type N-terminal cleavage/methylation domain-containing protein